MKLSQLRLALFGIALGVLLALLIAPQTRWLVRLQTVMTLHQAHPFLGDSTAYTTSAAQDARQIRAAVARHPDDFPLQLGAALQDARSAETLSRLQRLTATFPGKPALYAAILNAEMQDNIPSPGRPEENELYGLPVVRGLPRKTVDPVILAAFDRAAAEGERRDPDNAFFPTMRAVGLFDAYRDADALAAVKRASGKAYWRDYAAESTEARWKLHEEAFGDLSAFSRVAFAAYSPFYNFARVRALARLVRYKAVEAERAGQRQEGLKIRQALLRVGSLIRASSTGSAIVPLVGIAITQIASSNPGGKPNPKSLPGLSHEEVARRRRDAYVVYVTGLGHPEAAAQARAEEEAGRKVLKIINAANTGDRILPPIHSLFAWWAAGLTILVNLFWLLLLGLVASGLARLRPLKTALLSPGAEAGVWGRPLGIGLMALGFVVVVLYGLVPLALWLSGGLNEVIKGLQDVSGTGSADSEDARQAAQRMQMALGVVLGTIFPVVMAIVFLIAARVRRIPVLLGLGQGFRIFALPVACVLVLAWGGALLGTLRQEQVVNTQVWHQVHDEGPSLAAQAGQTWPGPVR